MNQKFICTNCERTHKFKYETFIRCKCGNVIINPKFFTKEKNLKTDKRSFKELIEIILSWFFLFPILYVIGFWIIGGLFFGITGWDKASIQGLFFADNIDPKRSSLLEQFCHPIFFILLWIGYAFVGVTEFVKNKKIKEIFGTIGAILILILFLGGCTNGCIIQSGFDKIEKNKKQYKKQYENSSMIATHMTVYHPYITKIDLGKIRVSSWNGKIDCDYCDSINKIKGNY